MGRRNDASWDGSPEGRRRPCGAARLHQISTKAPHYIRRQLTEGAAGPTGQRGSSASRRMSRRTASCSAIVSMTTTAGSRTPRCSTGWQWKSCRPGPSGCRRRAGSELRLHSPEAARRLFAIARRSRARWPRRICAGAASRPCTAPAPCASTPAATIDRPHEGATTETWPALIAAVTDLAGTMTGAHRTWLDPSGCRKAPIATPRRATGHLLGNAVRFGIVQDVMAVETMVALRTILPARPMVAALSALSANHLAAILSPATIIIRPATIQNFCRFLGEFPCRGPAAAAS
jgi:hypothetical protein